jgi:hypothetical protein
MDNFFQQCPPKMSDQGRHLTDFQSSTRRDEYVKYVNDIHRDDQYRLFLQTNGKQIMDREWTYHNTYNRCWVNDCVHNYPTRCLPNQYWQERQAADSVFNPNTREKLAPLRRCVKHPDYRMTQ